MKSSLSFLVATILTVGSATPVYPQAAGVPPEPNVVDVAGDANYLADRDTALPAQHAPEADLLEGWFTATSTHVTAHIHVAADPRLATVPMNYQMWANGPAEGWVRSPYGRTCLVWASGFTGMTNPGSSAAVAIDWCWNDGSISIPMKVRELPEGTFMMSMSAPRSMSPALRSGRVIKNPYMVSRQRIPQNSTYHVVDTTETGRDFLIP